MIVRGPLIGLMLVALATLIWWGLRGSVDAETGAAVDHFFREYVTDEGRVRRPGGDTVSEGQAYALLMAVATASPERFDLVWDWTDAHLVRSDGAMSWLWDGRVVDTGMAPDADVDAAVALFMAAERFEQPAYSRAAARMAAAVMESSTVLMEDELHLSAGEWVEESRVIINPSYLDPASFEYLGRQTGDRRWNELSRSARRLLAALISNGLPPDWVAMTGDEARPIASPGESDEPARFSFDAVRVPIRLSTPCTSSLAHSLSEAWPEVSGDPGIAVRHLDGRPAAQLRHPAAFVSAAALAAHASPEQVEPLLDLARDHDQEEPTYYGAAWVALGRLMLTTSTLERCA